MNRPASHPSPADYISWAALGAMLHADAVRALVNEHRWNERAANAAVLDAVANLKRAVSP